MYVWDWSKHNLKMILFNLIYEWVIPVQQNSFN